MQSRLWRSFMILVNVLIFVFSGCGRSSESLNYPTYVFTHSELVLFGYTDDTTVQVTKIDGRRVWRGKLDEGENHRLRPGSGVYHVAGSHPYATLVGDPTKGAVMGYYALDQLGQGTSQLFYTYQSDHPGGLLGLTGDGMRDFVVFAYQDGTSVTIKETDTGSVVWQGTLNAGEAHSEPDLVHVFLTVEASQPVSALSYGDQGYYVPSENGKFTGLKFYTWAGDAGRWVHDLNVIAYRNNATVSVLDTDTGEVLWQGTLQAGEIQTVSYVNGKFLTVEATESVAVSVSPTTSYKDQYAHMIFAQDEDGVGIGRKFYYPTIDGARLQLFAYEDGADIEVLDASGAVAYQGTLNRGESKTFDSIQTLYTINSTQSIAALMDWGDEAGADFAPPYYATSTAALPVVTAPRWLPVVAIGTPLLALTAWGVYQLLQSRSRRSSTVARPQIRSGPTSTGGQTKPPKSSSNSGANITHNRPASPPSKRR